MQIHIVRERIRKSLWKEFWKFQYNEINLGSVFQVKNMYAFMEEILLWHLKLVSTIFSYAIKIKLLKNYQKCFLFYQKISFCPQDYQIFVLHPFLCTSLWHLYFPKLDFKNTDSLISGEVKFRSRYSVNWQNFILRKFSRKNLVVPRSTLVHLISWQTILLNWCYSLETSVRVLEWGWFPKLGQAYNYGLNV